MTADERLHSLLVEEEMERARNGLLAFTLYTKPDYEVNWHHRAACRKLNQFARGEIKRLLFKMPPRHGKSELVSRRLPAFLHGRNPNAEIMLATYNGSLASDMSIDVQRIIDSDRYRKLFPRTQITPEGTKTAYARNSNEYEIIPYVTPQGEVIRNQGSYRAQGVGGSFTGRGANFILIDDPVKNREDADSLTYRDAVWNFYTSTLYTRLEKDGQILLTMTRWHEDDLAGRLIELAKSDPGADQWEIVDFPAIKEQEGNPDDPREIGEPLWENKYSRANMASIKSSVGLRDWASLYQQEPSPDEGNVIQRAWIRIYDDLPADLDEKALFVDLSFKEGPATDFTVIEAWGRKGTNIYLIDQIRGRMDFPTQMNAIRNMAARHPDAYEKQIEEAANGAAIISLLRHEIMGLVPVRPHTSKEARLAAVSPLYQAGNVHYPNPKKHPWVDANMSELLSFPSGKHDDTVDVASMALMRLGSALNSVSRLEALSRF